MPNRPNATLPLDDGTGAVARLTDEALAGGYAGLAPVAGVLASVRLHDENTRRYGDLVYDCVDRDQAAGSSVELLIVAALSNDLQVVPSVQLEPGAKPKDAEEQARVDLSHEVAAWCDKQVRCMSIPVKTVARAMIHEALKSGAAVADKVWELRDDPDDGLQLWLKAVKQKERSDWKFDLDAFFNLHFIRGAGSAAAGSFRWPRRKFMVLTWGGRGCDPRGQSVYFRAVEPWNFRAQLPEDHFRFLKRHGSPKVIGKVGGATLAAPNERDGTTPLARFLANILKWVNGTAITIGATDSLEVHEVKTEGAAFTAAMDFYGGEIVKAVLLQTRATVEAKHGSKADSETGQDMLGHLVLFLRTWFCEQVVKDLFYEIVFNRWGEDVARVHTPGASLGKVEHPDVATLMRGLQAIGYSLTERQMPAADKYLGVVPPRDPDEEARLKEEQAAKDAERAAQAAAARPGPAAGPAGNEPPPPPPPGKKD